MVATKALKPMMMMPPSALNLGTGTSDMAVDTE
jgi:hypothetical protein